MDSSRVVNYNLAVPQDGAEYADGSFNTAWTRLSLGASYDYAVTDALTITPEVVLGYIRANVDGYTEEGATANASVGSRSADLTELEVALNVSFAVGPGFLLGSVG